MRRHKKVVRYRSRRFQRCFLEWLGQNRARFALKPRLDDKKASRPRLFFRGITNHVKVSLGANGIFVVVMWQGEVLDILGDFDSNPQRSPQRYFSGLVLPEYRKSYFSKDALWRKEVFEPFLTWVNERLTGSNWLGMIKTSGMTEACLLREFSDLEAYRARTLPLYARLKKIDGTLAFTTYELSKQQAWFVPIRDQRMPDACIP